MGLSHVGKVLDSFEVKKSSIIGHGRHGEYGKLDSLRAPFVFRTSVL